MSGARAARALPGQVEERRRRRRELRAAHPDTGGSVEQFNQVVQQLHRSGLPAQPEVSFVRRPRGLARGLARVLAWWRARRYPPPRRVQ